MGFSLDNTANSTYSYGRLNQINGLGGNFQYSYSGLLENLTRPNGVSTQWNYEAHRDLITQVANGNVSTVSYISAFTVPDILSYGYNDRSEVISAQSNT